MGIIKKVKAHQARRLTRRFAGWSDAGRKHDAQRLTRRYAAWSDAGRKHSVQVLGT